LGQLRTERDVTTRRALRLALAAAVLAALGWRGYVWYLARAALADTVVVRLPAGSAPDLSAIRFEPAAAVRAARVGAQGWLALERVAARSITLSIPGMCPVTIPAGKPSHAIEVKALFDLGPDRTQIGFAAPFEIRVKLGCAEARRGAISWRQIEGPALAELTVREAGLRLRARTLPLATLHPEPLAHGIVPLSPRTQGRYVLEAVWRGDAGSTLRRTLTITSIARATGVPSIAVSQQVLLGGSGWHVQKPAPNGQAQVQTVGALALFAPDVPGRWLLEDAAARPLTLQAAWHDTTPIDCGRAGCHASAAQGATDSPMSHAFERRFDASPATLASLACTLDCHVVGERGLHDGGFLDVAAGLDWRWLGRVSWQDLPQALRRLGGVRCTSCHGPGAIPEAGARSKILQSDVCANCHDAPPRYLHVEQWRASRMSRADAKPETRAQPACERCHTTGGFLAAIDVRPRSDPAEPGGIACAACHAPHAVHRADALVRSVPVPSALGGEAAGRLDARSALCASCHAPLEGAPLPAASAAALWAGRVRVPDANKSGEWELVRGPAPHGSAANGCIGCHGAHAPAGQGVARLDHSFRVRSAACATCHEANDPAHASAPRAELRSRVIELERRIARSCVQASGARTDDPPHATTTTGCRSQSLTRALYELRLLVEDPAAWVHNAAFARQLLADAEAQLHD
jgi:hypothetical protein